MKNITDLTHRFYINPDQGRPVSRSNYDKHPFGSQQARFQVERKEPIKDGGKEKDKRAKRI